MHSLQTAPCSSNRTQAAMTQLRVRMGPRQRELSCSCFQTHAAKMTRKLLCHRFYPPMTSWLRLLQSFEENKHLPLTRYRLQEHLQDLVHLLLAASKARFAKPVSEQAWLYGCEIVWHQITASEDIREYCAQWS